MEAKREETRSARLTKSIAMRLTQTGWQEGDEWNKAYEYLAVGNAQLLAMLHHRFISGPTDWTK
jgi:hypothetical protein